MVSDRCEIDYRYAAPGVLRVRETDSTFDVLALRDERPFRKKITEQGRPLNHVQ